MSEANIWQPRDIIGTSADTKRITQRFTASEGQTLFNITEFAYVTGTGALEVYRQNSDLSLPATRFCAIGTDFIEQTATSFAITEPAVAGEQIVAVAFVGITGDVDVRDTDIFVANYQAIRDYAGIETSIYSQGKVALVDGGDHFFSKVTGAALGYWVDNNYNIIVPTGGDGSIAWLCTGKPFGSIANAKKFSLADNTDVYSTISYYTGYLATLRGPVGGANYTVVTKAQHDTIRGYSTVDEYGDHTLANGNVLLLSVDGDYESFQYGCIGFSGVDDDTSAITALYAAITAAGGGNAIFHAGTYGKIDTITLPANSHTKLSGGATIQSNAYHNPMFLNGIKGDVYTNYGANGNIKFEGGKVTPRSSLFAGSVNCFSIGQSKQVYIEKVHMQDLQDFHFIEYNAVDGGWVTDCFFEDFIDSGARDFSEAIQLDYMASSAKFGSFGAGSFDKSHCKNIFLTNNKFKDVGRCIGSHSWEGPGIAPNGIAEGVVINGVTLNGATLTDIIRPDAWTNFSIDGVENLGLAGDNGLLVDDCDHFSVGECNLGNVTGNGAIIRVALTSDTTNFSLDEITVLSGADGIDIKDATNADIGKVKALNVTGVGVRITDCNRVGIQNPKVVNSGSNGIKVLSSVAVNLDKGNVQGAGATGVFFDQCQHSTIDGTVISSGTTNSISVDNTDNVLRSGVSVKNTSCIANGIDGIQMRYAQNCDVQGNTVSSAVDGVKLIECQDVNVNGNSSYEHSGWGITVQTNSKRISVTGNVARVAGAADGGLEMTNTTSDNFVNANNFKTAGTSSITDNSTGSNVVTGGNNVFP
jgi:hypothetical protein